MANDSDDSVFDKGEEQEDKGVKKIVNNEARKRFPKETIVEGLGEWWDGERDPFSRNKYSNWYHWIKLLPSKGTPTHTFDRLCS